MNFELLKQLRNEDTGFTKDVGITIETLSEGYAQGALAVETRHLNPRGVVHGGCIFTLMDTVGGLAAMSRGNFVTTSSSHILYLNPAAGMKKLLATATEIKGGRSLLVYDVEVQDDAGTLISKGTFTFFRLKEAFNL